jgi:hypothetical protein
MPEELLTLPNVPDGLREAARRGLLVPFVGAGVSRLAGCPSWVGFADAVLRSLIQAGKFSYSQLDQVRNLNPRVKLSFARRLAKDSKVAIDYKALLHSVARSDHKDGCQVYRSLFKLGSIFVTTNYDEWLDDRIPEVGAALTPPSSPSNASRIAPMRVVYKVEEFIPSLLNLPNTVIHLHGSVLDPDKMILTTGDYLKHYANDRGSADAEGENRVLTFLEYLFSNRSVLFIGYGLEELEILEYVLLKAGKRANSSSRELRHYILQPFFSHEEVLLRSFRSYYRNECAVELIPFRRDDKDYGQLVDVLEDFARKIPAVPPLVLQKAQEMEDLLNG